MSSLKNKIELVERDAIINALRKSDWVQARAAKVLGITERMIGYKIRKYNIKVKKNPEETVDYSLRILTDHINRKGNI